MYKVQVWSKTLKTWKTDSEYCTSGEANDRVKTLKSRGETVRVTLF